MIATVGHMTRANLSYWSMKKMEVFLTLRWDASAMQVSVFFFSGGNCLSLPSLMLTYCCLKWPEIVENRPL